MTQPGNEYWCLGRTTCQSGVQSAASELVLIKLEVHWGVLHVSRAQTAALRRGTRRRLCAQSLPEADLSISPAFLCLWGDPCNPLLLIHLLSPLSNFTHTHTHTLYFLCGHLLFSILSPPFLLFIQHLICHTLTANLISFFLTFSPSFLLFPSPFSPCLLLADFSIHSLSCSFDFSSLTLLISFRAPPFSLTYCFSLCLSRSPRWSRW